MRVRLHMTVVMDVSLLSDTILEDDGEATMLPTNIRGASDIIKSPQTLQTPLNFTSLYNILLDLLMII